LSVDSSDFLRLYRKAGESNIIALKVGKKNLEVLVHSVQKHPVTGAFTHVDFYAITRGEAVHTKIHFNFIGTSPAVKEGAIIEELMKEIEVKCMPRDLVDHFEVDLTLLKEAGDIIRVSDIGLDDTKYDVHGHKDSIIASAVLPRAAVAESTEDEEGETEEGETEENKEA
jgi:large subunit ribosomal protein L25